MTVLEDVNLTVAGDDFVGIIGPNGGGKTTLLKTVLGLIEPFEGQVKVFGKPPHETRHQVGYVPQYTTFDEEYPITVKEVVLMGRRGNKRFYEKFDEQDHDETLQALQAVEMGDFENQPISELSGGQKQRVFLARALAADPQLLLLDEPTASVDRRLEKGIYSLLHDLNEDMAILVVTHDIGVISSYITKVACLNRKLYTHDEPYLSPENLEEAYKCPVELITHEGQEIPHRVLKDYHSRSEEG
ncbi:MAG: metal ABC transporter ATP-binding protein [Candidatus Acetothermia bacterium]